MGLLFRVIQKTRWQWSAGDPSWLVAGEVPAAPFADLKATPDSVISVWAIDNSSANLGRVVAVLAATKEHVDKLDCALVEEAAVVGLGIRSEPTEDPCPDQEASRRWHRDLVQLTGSHLRGLVDLIRAGQLKRFLKPQVEKLLEDGIAAGQLEPSKFDPKLRDYFREKAKAAHPGAPRSSPG